MEEKTSFSVLMSIYIKETPSNLEECLNSIWDRQTLKPSEIIVIKDGPLTKELDSVLSVWENRIPLIFRTHQLSENVGLGEALKIGINKCSYDLIARMDTDDIAFPERFRKQLQIFRANPEIDVVGSWVNEFENNISKVISQRKVPQYNKQILRFSCARNPVTHPTIMFRKNNVLKAGNYRSLMWFEDYYLWLRMLNTGSVFYNIQEPLIYMRAGYEQLTRRSGFKYFKAEILFYSTAVKENLIPYRSYLVALIFRVPLRLIPRNFLTVVYKLLRKV